MSSGTSTPGVPGRARPPPPPLPPLSSSSSSLVLSLETPADLTASLAPSSGSTETTGADAADSRVRRLDPDLVGVLYEMIARNQQADGQVRLDDGRAQQPEGGDHTAPKPDIPIARIKALMKRDGDVAMLSSDAPQVMSKASALFIADLTYQAWKIANAGDRRIIKKEDVMLAIKMNMGLDFLYDIIVDLGHRDGQ